MDLSQLSTEDLKALQGGDISKVSTAGLQMLRSPTPAAAAPPVAEKPPAGYEDNPATGYHYRPNTLTDNPLTRSPIYGAADVAGSGVLNLLGKIAAGYHGLSNLVTFEGADKAADTVNADRAAMHTEASSPGAKTVQNAAGTVAAPFQAAAAPLDKAIANAGPLVSTAVPAVSEAIQDISSLAPIGAAGRAAKVADEAALAAKSAKPVVGTGQQAIETGRAAGFKFTPAAVESRQPGADVPNPIGGVSLDDRRAINLHNQARATELAGEHIGVSNATTLPAKAFEDAKQPHIQTYRDTGNVLGSGLTGSPDLVSSLEAQVADTSPKTALPGPVATQTSRILNAAKSGNLSGPQMVSDISWLRANGGRSVANSLENEMETQLAKTPAGSQQLGDFRDARTSLAQINDLQRAAAKGGGQISLPHLVAIDAKNPNLLTGTPKLLAQTAAAAPQDFRLPSGVAPGSSPVSAGFLQKIPLAGTASHAILSGAEKGIKWAAKKVAPAQLDVTSDAFQNRLGRVATPAEASYFKDLGKRPSAPSQPFELQNAPGATGIQPQQLGMDLAQGRPAAPNIELAAPEGQLGEPPSRQLGMEIAQGRPLEDQKLALKPSEGELEPHQPSLLGHEGTPEGGSRKPKGRKRGKD